MILDDEDQCVNNMMIQITSQTINLYKMLCLQFEALIYVYNQYQESTTLLQMLRNTEIDIFTQFNGANEEENQQNALKSTYNIRIEATESNQQLNCPRFLEIDNFYIIQRQLIVNYPQSQQNAQTVTIEQNYSQKNKYEQEQVSKDDNCMDIESIINPNSTEKLIAQIKKNQIQVEEKSSIQVFSQEKQKQQYKSRDETKNIPKNYIKAVFSFILQNPMMIKKMFTKKRSELETCQLDIFLEYILLEKKKKIFTIGRLKQLWLNQSYGKIMRILYANFIRRRSLCYIYSSKIQNKMSHIKHRSRLLQSLQDPCQFSSFK